MSKQSELLTSKQTFSVAQGFSSFAETIRNVSGVNVNSCFQCTKCASGCPVSYAMDYTPPQLLHAIQLGLSDLVFQSKTIWLCASCQTCTTRCPQDVDLAAVMDAIRIIAQRQKLQAKVPEIPTFYQSSLRNISLFGRMYELGLVATLKLTTRSFMKEIGLGLKMLKKRKLNLLPSFHGASAVRKILARIEAWEKI